MKRYTKRHGDGVSYTHGNYIITCYPKNDNLSDIDKMAVRLCELEEKIESGLFVELPCGIGETVYAVKKRDDYFIEETKATGFTIKEEKIEILSEVPEFPISLCGTYLTRKGAEARLKELQK